MRFAVLALAVALATSVAATTAAADSPAPAIDAHRAALEQRARALVERHFTAIAAGDIKALRRLWDRSARIIWTGMDHRSQEVPLDRSLARWARRGAGTTWTIDGVAVVNGGVAVNATVVWNGSRFRDVLLLRATGDGELRLFRKSSRFADEAAASERATGYGSR